MRRILRPKRWTSAAISYSKGCYIGQEVIARIRTYGQVAKSLRGLKLEGEAVDVPVKGAKILLGEKEAGYITSAVRSPLCKAVIASGYVRRGSTETAGSCSSKRRTEKFRRRSWKRRNSFS